MGKAIRQETICSSFNFAYIVCSGLPGFPPTVGSDDSTAQNTEEYPKRRMVVYFQHHKTHPWWTSSSRQQLLVCLSQCQMFYKGL